MKDIKDTFGTPINVGDLIVRAGNRMDLSLKIVTEKQGNKLKVIQFCKWSKNNWTKSTIGAYYNCMVINKNSLNPLNEKHKKYLEMLDEIRKD